MRDILMARRRAVTALKELDYEPNRYASALASNKNYRFVAFIPSPELEPYWGEVSQGLQDAIQNYRDFNLSLEELYYDIFSPDSYNKGLKQMLDRQPDGVILAPQLSAITYNFCQHLKEKNIPFTFLDSNIHDLDALTFYGQDSLMSGRFAARMSMLEAAPEKEFLIVHFDLPSLQQYNREVGFREFIHKNYPGSVIHELSISPKDPKAHEVLTDFREKHPDVHFVCTFCSHTHVVARFIQEKGITDWHMMGYDMLDPNVKYLKHKHGHGHEYDCFEDSVVSLSNVKLLSSNAFSRIVVLTEYGMPGHSVSRLWSRSLVNFFFLIWNFGFFISR